MGILCLGLDYLTVRLEGLVVDGEELDVLTGTLTSQTVALSVLNIII